MSGRGHDVNCCKSCWYRGLMVITGMALRRPDKTGHFRTLGHIPAVFDELRGNGPPEGGTPNGQPPADLHRAAHFRMRRRGVIFTCQRVAGRASTPGQRGTEKRGSLYSKGVCCVILHKKTRQAEGVGLGSSDLAGGYGFWKIGGELFWPDFAAMKS